jgi:pimeloyl-ACP methyl ester carboxylesterase
MALPNLDRRGSGSARLLFTSGWLGETADWDLLRDRFDHLFTAAYAPSGFSAAATPNGAWSFDGSQTELERILDTLAPSDPVVVGSSAGGSTALAIAAHRPVRGVIAIGAAPRWITRAGYPFGFPAEMADGVVASLRASFAATVEQVMPGAYLDEADPVAAAEIREAIVGRAKSATNPGGLTDSLAQALSVDIIDALPSIHCPVLLISGERDHVVTPEMTQFMAARIPGCEVEIIPGAGHLPHMTAAAAVSRAILRFVARVGGEA